MKLVRAVLVGLLAGCVFVSGVEPEAEAVSPEYRAYLDAKKSEMEAHRKERKKAAIQSYVGLGICLALFTVFGVYYCRAVRRSLAIGERQQKTLEEIRELLKKE